MPVDYMNIALEEAKNAFDNNEIPVGCVIVSNGKVIAKSHNTTVSDNNDTHHAEINAINFAIKTLNKKNLTGCEMYVTLEPCPMCAGAIINSKIKRVYIGAQEPKSGCFGSVTDLCNLNFNHKPEVYIGIKEDECKLLMRSFFINKR